MERCSSQFHLVVQTFCFILMLFPISARILWHGVSVIRLLVGTAAEFTFTSPGDSMLHQWAVRVFAVAI
jgi:hypothetical protein